MNAQVWSWVLTAVGLTGFYLSGNKVWWAWYVNLANQLIWIPYSIITHQWGFLVGALFYTAFFTRNSIKWTREHRRKIRGLEEAIAYAKKNPYKPDVFMTLDTSRFQKGLLASKEQLSTLYPDIPESNLKYDEDGVHLVDSEGEKIRVESTPLDDEPCTAHYVFGNHVIDCRLGRHDMDGEHEGQHFDVSGREVTTIRWAHSMMYIVGRRRQEEE